jgi:hypothetical protein
MSETRNNVNDHVRDLIVAGSKGEEGARYIEGRNALLLGMRILNLS